jgi:hypothetical protein
MCRRKKDGSEEIEHPIVASTKARRGFGFGPKNSFYGGMASLAPMPSIVKEEFPYDDPERYSCSTFSTNPCVEECVIATGGCPAAC